MSVFAELWRGNMSNLDPIKLSPAFKDYLWGGDRLKKEYNKHSDMEKIAESWELSTHKDGESVVSDGEYKGMKLSEYIKKNPENVLGSNASKFDFFPILIKFIDAKDNLSIQVHPDDEYSLKNNGEYGKTEMWYILDCDEGSFLYYGFDHEITLKQFKKAIEENTLLDLLNKVEVKKGDVFFIEAGTVHAIGKGIVICEIQQNSNITYRVYDYNRKDKNGKTRPLHIEQAIAVAKTVPPKKYVYKDKNILAKCKYFTVKKADIHGEKNFLVTDGCFKSIIVISGGGELILNDHKTELIKGDSVFIPAQNADFKICGNCEVIISYV